MKQVACCVKALTFTTCPNGIISDNQIMYTYMVSNNDAKGIWLKKSFTWHVQMKS
jgi:hypothetical protein